MGDRDVQPSGEKCPDLEEQKELIQGDVAIRVARGSESAVGHKRPTRSLSKGPRQALNKLKASCQSMGHALFSWDRIPGYGWARSYSWAAFTGDVIAGVTTALTVIPQGIGYAPLAELPLQYGLYAALIPGFVYALFGTCKEMTIGPTAVNALLSYNYSGSSVVHALTLAFFCGIIEMICGLLNMGFLVNYMSSPVISAFTAAVSILVITSQIKGLLGLKVPGRGFIATWRSVFHNVHLIRPADASVGFAIIGILLFLRKLKDFKWCEGADAESVRAKIIQKMKWTITISRNCLVVMLATAIAYYLAEMSNMPDVFILTGDVTPGLPAVQLPWQSRDAPPQSVPDVTGNSSMSSTKWNGTSVWYDPIEIAQDLGVGLFLVPLISIMPNVAMAKFYAPPSQRPQISQEIFAQGVCQLVGSFFGSMVITASIGRSAVNAASGVRTPFGGVITGLIIVAACAFLTPYFAYIPTTSVAAVIIAAMIFTLEIEILLPIWRSKKVDLIPYSITLLIGVFLSVEVGIIAGTLAHAAMLIYMSNESHVNVHKVKDELCSYFHVQPDRALYFPSVDTIRSALASEVAKLAEEGADHDSWPIIIDLTHVIDIDFTAARAVRFLAKGMKKSGHAVYFCSVNESVEKILQGVDPSLLICYADLQQAQLRLIGS